MDKIHSIYKAFFIHVQFKGWRGKKIYMQAQSLDAMMQFRDSMIRLCNYDASESHTFNTNYIKSIKIKELKNEQY